MAWYPGATRYELQPESDDQPAIRPTQFIFHSIAAPWTAKRVYEYWRDSTNLESHFGLGYEGDIAQFIGTETRADANYQANRRPDGTGAISLESASNLEHTDPWTAQQIPELIDVGVWAHRTHGIPLRICRTHNDPGFGYHSLHSEWSVSGTACPGAARIKQFKEVVFPGIVARAAGTPQEDDDMTPEDRKLLTDTAAAVRRLEATLAQKPWTYKGKGDPRDMHQVVKDIDATVRGLKTVGLTPAQIDTLVDKIGDSLAARLAN
ncbi:hypothetical protein [Streptomyces sp. NPDC058718]|uniref:hypothetical protein n=1 Tax=Streptomyces sp. NPDC058718 TaxID=3346610 RepID=UPI0036A1904F